MGCSNASLFYYNPWPLPDRYVMEWSMTSRMLTCFFVGSFPRNDRIIHPLVSKPSVHLVSIRQPTDWIRLYLGHKAGAM